MLSTYWRTREINGRCPVQSSRPENMEDSLTQDPESEEQTIQFWYLKSIENGYLTFKRESKFIFSMPFFVQAYNLLTDIHLLRWQ